MKRAVFTILMLISGAAFASNPDKPAKKGSEYSEPAGTFYGNWHVCTADDTDYVAGTNPGGSTPLCIPFGSQTIFWASGGNFDVTWSQTASITYDNASIGADSCDVADANGADGQGACFAVMSGLPWNEVPTIEMFKENDIGRRTKVCDTPREPFPEATRQVWIPCNGDSECSGSLGAGSSCAAPSYQRQMNNMSCAMVVFQCDTDGALLYIGTQK